MAARAAVTGNLWLAALLLLPAAGWPLVSHPAFRCFPIASRLSLAGGAAAALVSLLMTIAALAGLPWHVAGLLAATALAAAGLRAALAREPACPAPPGEPLGAGGAVAGALTFGAILVALVATVSGAASSPDLVFFWGVKAQHFAAARGVDVAFLQEPSHLFMHAYYPPLVTNLFALASMLAGRFVWTAALLTFPLLLAALAAGLAGVLRERLPRPAAAAFGALVVCAIGYLGIEADIAGNGEMPLLFFETLAAALLLSPRAADRPIQLLAGLLLSGAAAAKVEGLPFVLAAAILSVVGRRGSPRSAAKSLLWLLGPTALALGAWFAFGVSRGLFVGYGSTTRFMDIHAGHLPHVVKSIGLVLFSTGYGLPWLVPLAVLSAQARGLDRGAILPLGIAAALTVFLLFTYIHRAEDPSLWISWSAARVFSPVAMLIALASTLGRGIPGESRTAGASPA